jgi:hypothetical protein
MITNDHKSPQNITEKQPHPLKPQEDPNPAAPFAPPLFGGPGGHGEGAPPDPIPNSAVKPLSADGTAS